MRYLNCNDKTFLIILSWVTGIETKGSQSDPLCCLSVEMMVSK